MIEKLEPEDSKTMYEYVLAEKLNEVIEALNNMKKVMDFEESHNCITNAARKAAMSGSLKDLQEYLRLRGLVG